MFEGEPSTALAMEFIELAVEELAKVDRSLGLGLGLSSFSSSPPNIRPGAQKQDASISFP